MKKRVFSLVLALSLALSLCCTAQAKTNPAGQTVDTTLFYVQNRAGEDILVSHVSVAEMEADMQAGKIDSTNHNYSILDRYVTTVHQEAQGFTVPDYVTYAQSKSSLAALRSLPLTFAGTDKIAFWEIDQNGFDDQDTYSYNDLYGVARYNFPLLYEYWNYRSQDYSDPAGVLSRDAVIEHILSHGEPASVLLAVRAYSQRFLVTDEKYSAQDYNMEDYWKTTGKLDNQRALRIMKPMTEAELRSATPTASDTRYWVANIRLQMAQAPSLQPLGKVAAPTAVMTEDAENYYIRFSCTTPGATILYNQNYISPSYTPSCAYSGTAVAVPKKYFPGGTVTMTCRAVKDGYTDAGVQTLTLRSSGEQAVWNNPYADVSDEAWYYDYVQYVTENALFDAQGKNFEPDMPMTRAMLAKALYRMAGSPQTDAAVPFTDVPAGADYAAAVAWCYQTGVVNGTSATSFKPNGSITREQITAMFHRYAEKIAKGDMRVSNELAGFADSGKLGDWARESMRWAVGAGLINGTSTTTLSSQGTATRAQCAAMVQRLARYLV